MIPFFEIGGTSVKTEVYAMRKYSAMLGCIFFTVLLYIVIVLNVYMLLSHDSCVHTMHVHVLWHMFTILFITLMFIFHSKYCFSILC